MTAVHASCIEPGRWRQWLHAQVEAAWLVGKLDMPDKAGALWLFGTLCSGRPGEMYSIYEDLTREPSN